MALIVLMATLILTPSSLPADDNAVNKMAEAMLRMMDAMGFIDDNKSGARLPLNPGNFGMPKQMPWSLPDMQQMPQIPGMPTGWQRTALEGIWEGREGGLLIVQAQRFRLYSPTGGYVEGLIQQRGDRVALYVPRQDSVRPYEFAQHQGRLVLRDAEGQVYLYRRLWFEPEDAGGSPVPR
ncbi:MAG TPA: hypothetical protein DDY14_13020 [Chromatiaceae bacterium]|jgi:hypothetical protein|nr:MAG: hypothetical protein N838_19740 [Thiohalocapsa sp. PB-PSB1]QQO52184.1 MAG: hypothetical protein N838_01100 [Thiohalocapsa sp. PB-PSB1]HBG96202.1 hypothetical protein [Chromatiaceae bacterium]HCS89058.1 hypothetical protein [Chromatiaceae bacterium]